MICFDKQHLPKVKESNYELDSLDTSQFLGPNSPYMLLVDSFIYDESNVADYIDSNLNIPLVDIILHPEVV